MSSFFNNLKTTFNNRENAIKEALINSLCENAKEIHFEYKDCEDEYLDLTECTNSFCTTLEAMFLHGLKDSFLSQTMNVIAGSSTDVDRRPEPSFWPPLLVFLHKQVIEQIQSLSQITTEIGYCRSWIRLSINESILSSYLNNMRKNMSALNPYYKKYAFIKDNEKLEIATKILEGIETCLVINLPINSSLLNHWTNLSLQISGLWQPPLRSCPITNGIDVATTLTSDIIIPTPKPLQTNEIFNESISNSPFTNRNQLSELCKENVVDENAGEEQHQRNIDLEILLRKVDEMNESSANDENIDQLPIKIIAGNSVSIINGWSNTTTPIDDNKTNNNLNTINNQIKNNTTILNYSRSNSMTTSSMNSLKSPIDHHSYNTLLVRHQNTRELDWNDVWERFETSLGMTTNIDDNNDTKESFENKEDENSLTCTNNDDNGIVETYDYVTVTEEILNDKFSKLELQQMVEQCCKLSNECGLDSQGFVCKSCSHPIGIGFSAAQVCSFNGNSYCESCISVEQYLIPAKIIYNCDFRKYYVSRKAAAFLNEFQFQPFIDLKLLNPDIYMASEEMATLQSLRIRLNFIRAYLFTCSETIIDDLQKQIKPKEYLYEHIHRYSINDLFIIQKGTLVQLLQKIVQFGEQHIMKCPLCSVKGFICEICNSPKVLYPFHIDTTFRCQLCGAVFHAMCLNDAQPCPKCERKRKREDLPLLEAVHML